MKSLIQVLLATLALTLCAVGVPAGICLHAYSPEAPLDKVECFEFEKFERVASDYRFFLDSNKPAVVTAYRFRGTITYKADLAPSNPEFDKLLKLYEETARATPSTRRYLNPKILAMRRQATGYAEEQDRTEALPKITIDKKDFSSPRFRVIEDGKLVLEHKDGIAKLAIEKITNAQLQTLVKIDPKAGGIKVIEICGNRLWNPHYKGISNGNVEISHEKGLLAVDIDAISDVEFRQLVLFDPKFGEIKIVEISNNRLWNPHYEGVANGVVSIAHAKGVLTMDIDKIGPADFKNIAQLDPKFLDIKFVVIGGEKLWQPIFDGLSSTSVKIKHVKGCLSIDIETMDEKDKATVMSLSDGSWKIAKPGFYKLNDKDGTYGELVVENGLFYTVVKLQDRFKNFVTIKSDKGEIKVPIDLLAKLPGISSKDSARIKTWNDEYEEETKMSAKSITTALPDFKVARTPANQNDALEGFKIAYRKEFGEEPSHQRIVEIESLGRTFFGGDIRAAGDYSIKNQSGLAEAIGAASRNNPATAK